jgi:hypothetical protein|tara:strand:+ start:2530 stop:2859 length:330 start_codon:yes stop_codon:yes gene_type:complete
MSWKMDDDVLIYVLNELLESQRMVDIFKVMMEYEDFEMDWLAEQFLSLLERLDEYDGLSDRAGEFLETIQRLNFRKMEASSGDVAELSDDDSGEDSNFDDDFDDFTPLY